MIHGLEFLDHDMSVCLWMNLSLNVDSYETHKSWNSNSSSSVPFSCMIWSPKVAKRKNYLDLGFWVFCRFWKEERFDSFCRLLKCTFFCSCCWVHCNGRAFDDTMLLLYWLLTIEASLLDTEMTKHPGNQTVEYNNFQDIWHKFVVWSYVPFA